MTTKEPLSVNENVHVTDLPGYEYGQKNILEYLADLYHAAYTEGDGACSFTAAVEKLMQENGVL